MPPFMENPALPSGSRVLVTGANGFIASHIVDQLLELGYNVRGTVRAPKPWLDDLFQPRHDVTRFESVILADMNDAAALDGVLQDVSGIIHVASDVSMSPDSSVIAKTVTSTQLLLKYAARHHSVSRVVLTSSSTAAVLPQPNRPDITVTEDTWNDYAVACAYDSTIPAAQKPYLVYAASKTEGERQGWQWIADNKPGYVFNTVLPGTNFGKILHPNIGGSTMGLVRALLAGDSFPIKAIPPQWFVNVEDTARLHITALLDRTVASERIFAFANPFNWTDVLEILHKNSNGDSDLPPIPENEARDLSQVVPSRRAEHLLVQSWGLSGWTSLEHSVLA
ncbi:cinnamoyl-CoA reductase, partial [Aspergillus homomorphus CBS 101889]